MLRLDQRNLATIRSTVLAVRTVVTGAPAAGFITANGESSIPPTWVQIVSRSR